MSFLEHTLVGLSFIQKRLWQNHLPSLNKNISVYFKPFFSQNLSYSSACTVIFPIIYNFCCLITFPFSFHLIVAWVRNSPMTFGPWIPISRSSENVFFFFIPWPFYPLKKKGFGFEARVEATDPGPVTSLDLIEHAWPWHQMIVGQVCHCNLGLPVF